MNPVSYDDAFSQFNPFRQTPNLPPSVCRIQCRNFSPDPQAIGGRRDVFLVEPTESWVRCVAAMPEVRALSLFKCRALRDIAPLAEMTLEHLSLFGANLVQNWAPLAACRSAKHVQVSGTDKFDLGTVAGLENVEILNLGGDLYRPLRFRTFDPIMELERLRVLSLAPATSQDIPRAFADFVASLGYFNGSEGLLKKLNSAAPQKSVAG